MIKKIVPFVPVSLILVLLFTVLVLFNVGFGRSRYILFFPLDSMNGMNAEVRDVYRASSADKRLEIFLNELILGPVALRMNPFIPQGTKVRSFIHSGEKLYLDLDRGFLNESQRIFLDHEEQIELLTRNIQFNFPGIKEITVTVEGQIPGSDYYATSANNES